MERRDRFLPPYVSTHRLAQVLTGVLLTTAAISGVSAGFEVSQIQLLASIDRYTDLAEETRWAHTLARNLLLGARYALYAALTVLFIIWLHRCRVNARAFGCRRFRYSRIWTVLGFAIPILNFFRPYQVVSEVWRASDPRAVETRIDWLAMPVSRFVLAWWVTLLACATLEIAAIALVTHVGAGISELIAARTLGMLAGAVSASSAILAYLVVSGIQEAQQEKWSIIHRAEIESDAADPLRLASAEEPEPPALTPRSIWRAHTADS
jgi:hypothetical protein